MTEAHWQFTEELETLMKTFVKPAVSPVTSCNFTFFRWRGCAPFVAIETMTEAYSNGPKILGKIVDFTTTNCDFFPKRYYLGSVWALSVGVCEMWTTWMCLPVAVPAHPRILAGRRFLRISPNISGKQGVAGFPGDPILSTQRIPRSGDLILSTKYTEIFAGPRSGFYLHKEYRAAGIWFYLHKEFRAAEIWFYLHKEFRKKNREKSKI